MELLPSEIVHRVRNLVEDADSVVECICFDYFDTLVSRDVAPEYTKVIAAEHLARLLKNRLSGWTVYEIRREMEAKLCLESVAEGYDAEFDLVTLGRRLFEVFSTLLGASMPYMSEDSFVDVFVDLEMTVEIRTQTTSDELVELLHWLKEREITMHLISDFYVPGKYFRKFLQHHGLNGFFSEIFISGDHRISKSSGRLYGLVVDTTGCSPEKLVMIGDNPHSDFHVPRGSGIVSFLVDSREQKAAYSRWLEIHGDMHAKKNALVDTFDTIVRSGTGFFPEMASTLWLFTWRLFDQLVAEGRTNVFFCSKEGELLRKLFVIFQEMVYGRQLIQSHYLLVSRKATFICSLKALADEDFARLFHQYRDLSITEFLLSLNFSDGEAAAVCSRLQIDPDTRHFNFREHNDFSVLIRSSHFAELYERHRVRQLHHFRHYLDSFGVDIAAEGLALVDVGWKGSIQNNIYHALGGEIAVSGYYIGLLTPSGLTPRNFKKGLVFTDYPKHSPFVHVYNNNRSLFEMLLGASHGSADGYFPREVFDTTREVRKSTEYCSVGPEGEETIVTALDLPAERELYLRQILPLQEKMTELFRSFTSAYVGSGASVPDQQWFATQHARMVFAPSIQEIDFYSNLYHLENFGIFDFTRFGVDNSPGLLQRLRNLMELLKNRETVLETGVWPPIIFRQKGLLWLQRLDGIRRHRRIFHGDRS